MSDVTWFIAPVSSGLAGGLLWLGPDVDIEVLSLSITNNDNFLRVFSLQLGPAEGGEIEDPAFTMIQGNAPPNSQTCFCFPKFLLANSGIVVGIATPSSNPMVFAIEWRPYVSAGGEPPTVYAASVGAAGDELLVSFSKPIYGDAGFSLNASGGAVTLTPAVPGAANRRYDTSRIIAGDETLTLDYSPGDIQDGEGRPMAGFAGLAVANNSTAGGILAQDTFTDSNGTNLTAHTMDVGTGWTAGLGTITVQSNAAFQSASATAYIADAGQADYTLTVDLITAGSGATALGGIVRYTDSANYWIVEIDSTVPSIRLYQKTAGAYTTRASASPTISNATTYALEITCSGNTISATLDGGSAISYGSATQGNTSTLCGIGNTWTVNQSWDNFEVVG